MSVRTAGKEPEVVTDRHVAAAGGVRSVFVDVQTAAYTMGSSGPGNCSEFGVVRVFSRSYLEAVYGSQRAYQAKARTAVNRLAAPGWLTAADAVERREEILASSAPPQAGRKN